MKKGNQWHFRSVDKVGFLKIVLLKSSEKRTFPNKDIIIGAHKSAKFFKTGLCQQAHFGMKCHTGVDAGSGFVHTVEATAANVHDVTVAAGLLREADGVVYGDSAYPSPLFIENFR